MRRAGLRGALAGALTLVALHSLVQPEAAGRISGLFAVPGRMARRFLDPTVPALPERAEPSQAEVWEATARARAGGQPAQLGPYPDPFAVPAFAQPIPTGGD